MTPQVLIARLPLLTLLATVSLVPLRSEDAVKPSGSRTSSSSVATTDRTGLVTDQHLREQTGWTTLRTLSVGIELKAASGEYRPASAQRVFKTGEQFRLHVRPSFAAHLYVLVRNADGTHELLFPSAKDKPSAIAADRLVVLPENDPPFEFQGTAGTETLRIIVAPDPIPDIAPARFFDAAPESNLSSSERSVVKQLQAKQSEAITQAIKRQGEGRSVRSLSAATSLIRDGQLSRAIEVVAVEEVETQTVVTQASGTDKKHPLIAEIKLQHQRQ